MAASIIAVTATLRAPLKSIRMPADGETPWFLYLLECEGNTIYTGITTDVERRFAQHLAGTGAKYTRSRKPVRILAWQRFENRSEASKAEAAAKRLTSTQKRLFCVQLAMEMALVPGIAPA